MTTIAVYSLKGGVGKTTLAVNLAWSAAVLSSRRTLLWDLDPQAAATYMIGAGGKSKGQAQSIFARDVEPAKLIQKSTVERLDLLAADTSLRMLDRFLFDLGKKKRLAKLLAGLARDYDRIVLDCPPGLTEVSEQVMRAADIIIAPVIPSPLSERALQDVVRHLSGQEGGHPPILPVYSIVDRRRKLHREAMARHPDWPVVPMASAVEQMADRRLPVGAFAGQSPSGQAFARLWQGVEKKLVTMARKS